MTMQDYSRRKFLKHLGGAAALLLASRTAFTRPFVFPDARPFEMLVVGDSLVWGQGLDEKDKFYYLTKKWLETDVFSNKRTVNLTVRANSGAPIFLHAEEADALERAGQTEDKDYHPEVNVGMPTITKQVELALGDYAVAGTSGDAIDLVMLTGGITDITVADVLNSEESDEKLSQDIVKYCNHAMFKLLSNSARSMPNAIFVVVGYYPLFSEYSATRKVLNSVLELYKFPRALKFLVNNIVGKQFFKSSRDRAIKRSKIWTEDSNTQLGLAVDRLNTEFGKTRAVFVKSPITDKTTFGTKNSLVWEMGSNGRSRDPLFEIRRRECREEIPVLEETTGIDYSTRFCELAGLGHPNPEGSRAYLEEIKQVVRPLVEANLSRN